MKKAASIFLRAEIKQCDVENMTAWMENRNVTRFLNEDSEAPDDLRNLLEEVPEPLLCYHFNQNGSFFLVCDESEDSIGFVRLRRTGEIGHYEIVFAIGDEELWGNGYGTRAVNAALAQAFFEHRARKLTAKIYNENRRSAATVLGCGFCAERQLEHMSIYSITADDYFGMIEKKRA